MIPTLRILLTFFALTLGLPPSCQFASPPEQPTSGPGGTDYPHAAVNRSVHGEDAEQYWLFEPAQPQPTTAPLIVFLHGWPLMAPELYSDWIEHLVRRGNVVIFPLYQAGLLTPPETFLSNAIDAVRAGIGVLQQAGHIHPDLDRFALVGHSMGGLLAANMAAVAAESSLPEVKAVMCVEPGGPAQCNSWQGLLKDLSRIPVGTLLLTIVGDSDHLVADVGAKLIYHQTTQIPPDDKDCVVLVSDRYGRPPLMANHLAPLGFRSEPPPQILESCGLSASDLLHAGVDALDYRGLWKLFDGLIDAAFYSSNREYALGNTPKQRFMGTWSDGRPANELFVTDDP